MLLGKADQHFVAFRAAAVVLDLGVLEPGRVDGLADGADVGRLLELNLHLGAAAEIHAQRNRAASADGCAQCQPMEMMPATLKMREKARKYHFFPSQSMFTPRKNSTCFSAFLKAWVRE